MTESQLKVKKFLSQGYIFLTLNSKMAQAGFSKKSSDIQSVENQYYYDPASKVIMTTNDKIENLKKVIKEEISKGIKKREDLLKTLENSKPLSLLGVGCSNKNEPLYIYRNRDDEISRFSKESIDKAKRVFSKIDRPRPDYLQHKKDFPVMMQGSQLIAIIESEKDPSLKHYIPTAKYIKVRQESGYEDREICELIKETAERPKIIAKGKSETGLI